jgi:hypothetical protein
MLSRMSLTCLLLAALGLPGPVLAQADKPTRIYRLEPAKVADIDSGRAAMVLGKTATAPHRYYLEHLHMMVPVVVTLRPLTGDAELKLEIGKYPWQPAERQGQVRNGEQVSFSFRTQGEFQVSVSSEQAGTPYKLLVWVGDEVKPELKPVAVAASGYRGGTGARRWLWIGAGIAALPLVAGGIFIGRRKQA